MDTETKELKEFQLTCPIPIAEYPHVLLAHGGGGRLMHHLIDRMFRTAFDNSHLRAEHDGAELRVGPMRLAFTTDSYVVRPLFFPGSDIGKLAVYGTVNDLAMCGARPLFLSAGFILEEGLPMETLWQVVRSVQQAAETAGVQIVTGDTKVVDRSNGDGLYINTAGLGLIEHGQEIAPSRVRPGDAILLSGDIGRHGIAVMAVREGLSFESHLESDCAPLAEPVLTLLNDGVEIHCLRDLTRGGLASGLVEIARTAGVHTHIQEQSISVCDDVRGACEILGLDPLYVANEGRFLAFVPNAEAERALKILRASPLAATACRIGEVTEQSTPGIVTLQTGLGATRIIEMLSGEQLPRIC